MNECNTAQTKTNVHFFDRVVQSLGLLIFIGILSRSQGGGGGASRARKRSRTFGFQTLII